MDTQRLIINHTHQFIFIHVPKTAGSTISRLFARYTEYRDQEIGGTEMGDAVAPVFRRRFGLSKHSRAEQVRSVVGEDVWQSYFKFAFVRHPVDRALSTFRFLRRWRKWEGSDLMDRIPTIDDFVRSSLWDGEGPSGLLRPQSDYITDDFNFIGHIEDVEAGIAAITQAIGLPAIEEEIPRHNESPLTARERAPSKSTLEAIAQRYAWDFERFAYDVPAKRSLLRSLRHQMP